MNKIFFLLLIIIFNLGISFGKWYGFSQVNYGSNNSPTMCPTDGDAGDTICVQISSSLPQIGASNCPNSNMNGTQNGQMYCGKWDSTPPTISASNVTGKRTNVNINIILNATDTGGAGLKYSKYKWDDPDCRNGTNYVNGTNIVLKEEGRHTLYICASDNIDNTNTWHGNYYLDKTPPNIGNLPIIKVNGVNNGGNVLADSNSVEIKYGEGNNNNQGCPHNECAPLKDLEYKYELYNTQNNLSNLNKYNCNGENCDNTLIWNMTKVDLDNDGYSQEGIKTDGKRNYIFWVYKICDVAGNCTNYNKDYNWEVFANQIDSSNSIGNFNSFDDSKIGDNNDYFNGSFVLKDKFGNLIIPMNEINRQINYFINYYNDVYLDQYLTNNSTWGNVSGITYKIKEINNSVFEKFLLHNSNILVTNKIINHSNYKPISNIKDGKYNIEIKSYVPTNDGYDKAYGNLLINSLGVILTDNLGVNSIKGDYVENKSLKFKPSFDSTIIGTPFGSEGVGKPFTINFDKKTSLGLNDYKFMVKYSNDSQPINTYLTGLSFNVNSYIGSWIKDCVNMYNGNNIDTNLMFGNCSNNSKTISSNIGLGDKKFAVGYALIPGKKITPGKIGILSTHILVKYPDNNFAIWNSDIAGINNYNYKKGDYESNITQTSLHIKGLIGSSNYESQINSVIENEERYLGGYVYKGGLRSKFRQLINEEFKGFSINNINTDLKFEFNNLPSSHIKKNGVDIYYYKGNSKNIIIDSKDILLNGEKLIIGEGIDFVIVNDIQKKNINNTDGFGIVALKDSNGIGGNIFLKNNVTNLDTLIYADGGLISYKDNIKNTQEQLENKELLNQLYIRGVLWTFNTVGGSRNDPNPKCPYFIDNCSMDIAQKYDLEYARRGYFIKANSIDTQAASTWVPAGIQNTFLAGKIKCSIVPDINGDGKKDVKCEDNNLNIKNELDDSYLFPNINPFTNLTDGLKKKLASIIVEYDSYLKFSKIPVFKDI